MVRTSTKKSLFVKPYIPIYRSLRHDLYFYLSVLALFLSAYFPILEKQFIVLSIITGAKWAVARRPVNVINIQCKQSLFNGILDTQIHLYYAHGKDILTGRAIFIDNRYIRCMIIFPIKGATIYGRICE